MWFIWRWTIYHISWQCAKKCVWFNQGHKTSDIGPQENTSSVPHKLSQVTGKEFDKEIQWSSQNIKTRPQFLLGFSEVQIVQVLDNCEYIFTVQDVRLETCPCYYCAHEQGIWRYCWHWWLYNGRWHLFGNLNLIDLTLGMGNGIIYSRMTHILNLQWTTFPCHN